jgi:hypothetical protein
MLNLKGWQILIKIASSASPLYAQQATPLSEIFVKNKITLDV